jgi:glycogen operon protein
VVVARIYVSSTFQDLQAHRERVCHALRQLGHDVVAMEEYVAENDVPVDVCLADVGRCDVYVGIFAARYGFIPPGYTRSITELELGEARRLKKPILAFLLDESAVWPMSFVDKDQQRITELREALRLQHMVAFFRTADDLATSVTVAVTRSLPGDRIRPAPDDAGSAAQQQLNLLPIDHVPAPKPPAISNYLPDSNRRMLGRDADLRALAALLRADAADAVVTVALVGIAGVGKTQLATEIVRRYGQFFAGGVFWIVCSDPAVIAAQVAECGGAGAMALQPDFHTLPLDAQVRAVRSAWEGPVPRLLIFDNCEQDALLNVWRPRFGGSRVVLTSRRSAWSPELGVQVYKVGVLDRSVSIRLLQPAGDPLASEDVLGAIADELGHLPLALSQAASFMHEYSASRSAADYLNDLQASDVLQHPSLTRDGVDLSSGHDRNVARTFQLGLDVLDPARPTDALARALLARAVHFIAGEPIAVDLLLATLELPADQRDADLMAVDALKRLLAVGLIEEMADRAVRVHRLVAAFVRQQMSDTTARPAVERALARRYGDLRTAVAPGAERTSGLIGLVEQIRSLGARVTYSAEQIRSYFEAGSEGARVFALVVLGASKTPDRSCFDLIQGAISHSRSGFEQYQALVAARTLLPSLDDAQRQSLFSLLEEEQGNVRYIRDDPARLALSTQIVATAARRERRTEHVITADASAVLATRPSDRGAPRIPSVSTESRSHYYVEAGSREPLGATPLYDGVNFSIYSEHATSVELLLFETHDAVEPLQTIVLDPVQHRSFHFWHCFVRGLKPGAHYAYRVDGPWDPEARGHRFNPRKVLIDPYAAGITTTLWDRQAAYGLGDNLAASMRSVAVDRSDYDWEGDRPLNRPMSSTIIYEVHVGGFTRSSTSGVAYPGTFAGIVEKIPYLQQLGITAVQLMPILQFDQTAGSRPGPSDGQVLADYWGYSSIGFFAPHDQYCVSPEAGSQLNDFRDMVKALHRAGIEVILDMALTHTAEGDHLGPVMSFKGFANDAYYHLTPSDRQYYMDYSGCGNTLNCSHPIVSKLIVDCLEFWVREMHVDGFRFDEGSILSRGEDGAPMVHPPVIWHLELSEDLADTKLLAEAWDAAGLYQITYGSGYRWAEQNSRFRDDIRRFIQGIGGLIDAVASRIAGSPDIYQATGPWPVRSNNFITSHDGFTLNDLVSFNQKHNEANGEHNRDGTDDNYSWNCGDEGPTDDAIIESLRDRQVRNFAVILLLSQGVPMFVAGDEVRRTQHGNNNPYCQDNDLSWFDWSLTETNAPLLRFFQEMIAFRKRHETLQRSRHFTGETNVRGVADIAWHGRVLNAPEWNDPASRVLAYTLGGFGEDPDIHVMLNMHDTARDFELPLIAGRGWYRVVDTSRTSPDDIVESGQEIAVAGPIYRVDGHSVVVLISGDVE